MLCSFMTSLLRLQFQSGGGEQWNFLVKMVLMITLQKNEKHAIVMVIVEDIS